MTEAEWLASIDPQPMLEFLAESGKSVRKRRLFAVACCRRISHLLTGKGNRAVLVAEQFADSLIGQQEMHGAWTAVGFPQAPSRRYAASAARAASCSPGYDGTAHGAASAVNAAACEAGENAHGLRTAEQTAQAALLRDIIASPFRPSTLLTPAVLAWNEGTVRRIAQGIYDDRAFDRLPILADALEEAGCTNSDILDHCRQPGPHVRGCWAVDLILGKS
jgi:hypothetical protein